MKIRGAWRLKKIKDQFDKTVNRRGIILMYHRVADLECDPWEIGVSPSRFEEHMRVLNKYGRPARMNDIRKSLDRVLGEQKQIVVTFDDGYGDNFHNARPILKRHGIPATFFIVSGVVDSKNEFWWDELTRIIFKARLLPNIFELKLAGINYRWKVAPDQQVRNMKHVPGIPANESELSDTRLYYALWEILRLSSDEERKDALLKIGRWAGGNSEPLPVDLPMTSGELRSLADDDLFEIGSHTVNHPKLTSLPLQKQEEEIKNSMRDLEQMINKKISSFSYPFGDNSSETVRMVESSKFTSACTTIGKPVRRNDDPYLLPRFNVLNWTGEQFEDRLRQWLA